MSSLGSFEDVHREPYSRNGSRGDREGRTDDEHDERINVMTRRVYTCVHQEMVPTVTIY